MRNRTQLSAAALLALAAGAAGQPVPGPGQTVHWTQAMSPVQVGGTITIPVDGTLIIDAGVTVNIPNSAQIIVNGRLRAEGTAARNVELIGAASIFHPSILARQGRVELEFTRSSALVATADATLLSRQPAVVIAANSTFTGAGQTWEGGGIYSRWGTVALRDCTFTGAVLEVNDSYLLIDGGTLAPGQQLVTSRYKAGQPIHVDRVTAVGNPAAAPFSISGFDTFFAPGNTIQANLYPVQLDGGGIAPGSTLPTSGNINNYPYMPIPRVTGRVNFPDIGMPYVVDHDPFEDHQLGGDIIIEPGVTVKFTPGAFLWATYGSYVKAFGTPQKPITFEPLGAGAPWLTLNYAINGNRPHVRHIELRGSQLGFISDETQSWIDSALFENNIEANRTANTGSVTVRDSAYLNNVTGVHTVGGFLGGSANLDGTLMPNTFDGNTLAVDRDGNTIVNAVQNWWGDPSGPQHPTQNPSGQGDPVTVGVDVVPWRIAPPQNIDHPPLVDMRRIAQVQREGDRLILHWEASDDAGIVSQRLEWAGHDGLPLQVLVPNIPPQQRSVEIALPDVVLSNLISPAVFRVTAVDALGQEGFDEVMYSIYKLDIIPGSVVPHAIAGPLAPGQEVDITWDRIGSPSGTIDSALFLDSEDWAYSLGGAHTGVGGLSLGLDTPGVSTDLARVATVYNYGNHWRQWAFTPYFTIRPDAGIGDAPPAVTLTSPPAGATLPGGGVVNVAWNASDDDFVRSVDIHASYNGGFGWNTVVAGLPGGTSQYAWRLPPSSGINDVRVRVVVRDKRFQVTSSTSGPLSISAGQGGCYADCNADGSLNLADFGCFQTKFALGDAYADCNGDGARNLSDFGCFTTKFALGCP